MLYLIQAVIVEREIEPKGERERRGNKKLEVGKRRQEGAPGNKRELKEAARSEGKKTKTFCTFVLR